MNGITRNTFEDADVDTKLNVVFDYQQDMHRDIQIIKTALGLHPKDCSIRFDKLEKRRIRETWIFGILALFGGLIGGMGKSFKWW